MKEHLRGAEPKQIEHQIIHDVLMNPDLWQRVYKILDKEDFLYYKGIFIDLCEIFDSKRKISMVYLFDKGNDVSEFLDDPIFPTDSFFGDFIEVLRDKRIEREMHELLGLHDNGQIGGNEFGIKLKEIENKKLGALEVKHISNSLSDYYENYAARADMNEKGKSLTLKTGFPKFDSRIGLTRGELVTLAARTGIGKSAFSLNFALKVAESGKNVLFISLEMPNDQVFERIFAYETGIACDNFKFAKYGIDKFGTLADKINKKYGTLKIAYLPQATSTAVCSFARHIGGLDLLVVDYLQILKDPMRKNETNSMRIGAMTNSFLGLAGELNCCVISISQVNREASKGFSREPELHQLRDSGSIEQDSTKVLFLNRDKDEDPNRAILNLAKNRTGEEGFKIHYKADMPSMRFSEL